MVERKLHPGAKWLFRVRAFFTLLFLSIFIIIWSGAIFVGIFAVIFGAAVLITYLLGVLLWIVLAIVVIELYTRLSYRFWKYEFADSQLRIERGIIWKRYSNIPYQRMQNVDITRGIIARICGFSSVNIQTAGYSAPANNSYGAWSEGYIPAVSAEEAEQIREFVIRKITKKKGSGL